MPLPHVNPFRPGAFTLWLQDTDWSRALRGCLEERFGRRPTGTCGTDAETRRRYGAALTIAGYRVHEVAVAYTDDGLTAEEIVGGVYSAISADRLPQPPERAVLTARIRAALPARQRYVEEIAVNVVIGRV